MVKMRLRRGYSGREGFKIFVFVNFFHSLLLLLNFTEQSEDSIL